MLVEMTATEDAADIMDITRFPRQLPPLRINGRLKVPRTEVPGDSPLQLSKAVRQVD